MSDEARSTVSGSCRKNGTNVLGIVRDLTWVCTLGCDLCTWFCTCGHDLCTIELASCVLAAAANVGRSQIS